jgi:hypothetical protein
MRNKYNCEIHECFIYSLWRYRFYVGYRNKLSVEFIYKYVHLYSIVFMSARKIFGFWRFSDFEISDKGYSTCTNCIPINLLPKSFKFFEIIKQKGVNTYGLLSRGYTSSPLDIWCVKSTVGNLSSKSTGYGSTQSLAACPTTWNLSRPPGLWP